MTLYYKGFFFSSGSDFFFATSSVDPRVDVNYYPHDSSSIEEWFVV